MISFNNVSYKLTKGPIGIVVQSCLDCPYTSRLEYIGDGCKFVCTAPGNKRRREVFVQDKNTIAW